MLNVNNSNTDEEGSKSSFIKYVWHIVKTADKYEFRTWFLIGCVGTIICLFTLHI